jgi:hypothetical protein
LPVSQQSNDESASQIKGFLVSIPATSA